MHMKHLLISLVITLALSSCHKQYLVGYYNWDEFQKEAEWKTFVDEKYEGKKYMDSIQALNLQDSFKVQLFLGTYCPDSKKWVPRFYKLKEELPFGAVEIISVDTTKKDERGLAADANIKKIPTFIFYKEEKEVGRIVEKPKGRLEKNLYYMFKKM